MITNSELSVLISDSELLRYAWDEGKCNGNFNPWSDNGFWFNEVYIINIFSDKTFHHQRQHRILRRGQHPQIPEELSEHDGTVCAAYFQTVTVQADLSRQSGISVHLPASKPA